MSNPARYYCHACDGPATRGICPDARPICDTHIIASLVVALSEQEPLEQADFMDLPNCSAHDAEWSEIERIAGQRYAAVVAEAWAAMEPEELQVA